MVEVLQEHHFRMSLGEHRSMNHPSLQTRVGCPGEMYPGEMYPVEMYPKEHLTDWMIRWVVRPLEKLAWQVVVVHRTQNELQPNHLPRRACEVGSKQRECRTWATTD